MVSLKVFNTAYHFALLWGVMMVGAYVLEMRGSILDLIEENFNLVRRMEQGLIVLNDTDSKIDFANKPALDIIKEKPLKDDLETDYTVQDPKAIEQR